MAATQVNKCAQFSHLDCIGNTNLTITRRTDWAEDGEEDEQALPQPTVTKNSDGTETHISYRLREDGKKVKTTRIIKRTVKKEIVNPRVAERRQWAKFGASVKDAAGPQSDTTTVGEDIQLNPRVGFKSGVTDDTQVDAKEKERQAGLKKATVKCRICNGDHFTARCPFKGTMAPEGDPGTGLPPAEDMMAVTTGAGDAGAVTKGSYVPPALRKGATGAGERMGGGKFERDDLATLRVTNVSYYLKSSGDVVRC